MSHSSGPVSWSIGPGCTGAQLQVPGSGLQGQTDVNTAGPHTEPWCQPALTSHINSQEAKLGSRGHTELNLAGSEERGGGGKSRLEEAAGDDFTLVRAAGLSGEESSCSI